MDLTLNRNTTAIGVLTILYLVGIVGIAMPLHPDFVLLTPLNLLFSLGMILWFHTGFDKSVLIFISLAFSVGFGMEILGVQTGLVFGEYAYGKVLGPKIFGTPFMIGVNWILVTYCAAVAAHRVLPKAAQFTKAFLGASLLVLLDLLIEPVAIRYDFWSWGLTEVPLQNYIAWFVIGFILILAFYKIIGTVSNKVAIALLILQFLFFGILNLI